MQLYAKSAKSAKPAKLVHPNFVSLGRVPWLQVSYPAAAANPPPAAVKTVWAGLGAYPKPTPQEAAQEPKRRGPTLKQPAAGTTRCAVLKYVQQTGQVTVAQVAGHFNIDKQSARDNLRSLALTGYVLQTKARGVPDQYTKTGKYFVERTPKTEAVLAYLKAHPGATTGEIVAGTGGEKMLGLLGNLRRRGVLRTVGAYRSTRYWLAGPKEKH